MNQHRNPLVGLAYILVIALFIGMCVQAYRKALPWQNAVHVSLQTPAPGLELNPLSDVKFQGVRVGEVRSITSNGTSARIELAIDPDKTDLIPSNVDAAIVPKTLFGEKFVDLKSPAEATSDRIEDGAVIEQSTTSVELGHLFSRLVPVLRGLRPEQLSTVLNSLAEALDGRGEQLAQTLNKTRTYLQALDPQLSTLMHDVRQFARTSDIYADGSRELMSILSNAAGISDELLVPRETQLAAFIDRFIGTADQTRHVLKQNTETIVSLTGRSRPVLEVLEEYSTVLPCLISGLERFDTLATNTMGVMGPFWNLRVDLITQRRPYTYPEDLPSNPASDANNANLPDTVPSWEPHCPEFAARVKTLDPGKAYSNPLPGVVVVPGNDTATQQRGGEAELVAEARSALARAVAARLLGVSATEVPAFAELLLDPLVSGGPVAVR